MQKQHLKELRALFVTLSAKKIVFTHVDTNYICLSCILKLIHTLYKLSIEFIVQ